MLTHDRNRENGVEGYDVAQVCLNGHPANSTFRRMPQFNKKFCDECGAETITNCPRCQEPIRGLYWGSMSLNPYVPPKFCHNCGAPYPWTEKRLAAARDLTDELSGLNADEKASLSKSLHDLIKESPSTPVAIARFKRLVAKAGNAAAEGFKSILIDIVSEAVKKQIWPGM